MNEPFRIFPQQSSTVAAPVDYLYFFEVAISVLFAGLIAVAIVVLAMKYRRRSENEVPSYDHPNYTLEIAWTVIPFVIMLVMFFWGAFLFVRLRRPPVNAMTISVIGKQWMWKVQHPEGPREINALHVPINRPVKLIMTSQDVIHDFFIPAFRVKQDVIPGTFSYEWFEATKPGEYHIFCAQYCGNQHASMIGTVVAMEPEAYQAWLSGVASGEPPAVVGARIFQAYGCATCHGQRAPTMAGLYMSKVTLDNGKQVLADEDYLRESIVNPAAELVAGYGPVMPSFRAQLSDEQIMDLIEYIKSLASARANMPVGPGEAERPNEPVIPPGSAPIQSSVPATQPVNGVRPDRVPNQPPAREPIKYSVPRE